MKRCLKWYFLGVIFLLAGMAFSTELWIKVSDPTDPCPIFVNEGFVKIVSSDTIKLKNLEPGTYTISMFNWKTYDVERELFRQYLTLNPQYEVIINNSDRGTLNEIVQKGTFDIFMAEGDRKIITINNFAVRKALDDKIQKRNSLISGLSYGIAVLLILGTIVLVYMNG